MNAIAFSCPRDSSAEFANGNPFYAASGSTQGGSDDVAPTRLTQRQLEVLALLCEGLPNKLICRRLNIAPGTVKAHISSILRELGVISRLQAVVEARRLGLLDGRLAGSARGNPAVRTIDFGERAAASRYGTRSAGE